MSKPIKNMMVADYKKRFEDVQNALVIDIRGIEANTNNDLRVSLYQKDIHITVIKNSLAKSAFADTPLEGLGNVLSGPSALAYGGDSVVDVARELGDWAKKIDELELKAAILDGELFEGHDGVKRLSDYPTKEEAQATVIQLVLSPAGNLIKAATSPGSNIASVIEEIKTRLEDGKTIDKIA